MTTKEEELEDFNKYDSEIENKDTLTGVDTKINPDLYIHITTIKFINAVENLAPETYQRVVYLVRTLEIFIKAIKKLPADYEKNINEFIRSDKYINEPSPMSKNLNLAMHKFELLEEEIGDNKTLISSLKA